MPTTFAALHVAAAAVALVLAVVACASTDYERWQRDRDAMRAEP